MRILFFVVTISFLTACGKPVADFAFLSDEEKPVAPAEVRFENQSSNAESYEWDFGDGQKSTEASPVHKYEDSGNYLVKLKATKGGKTTVAEKDSKWTNHSTVWWKLRRTWEI